MATIVDHGPQTGVADLGWNLAHGCESVTGMTRARWAILGTGAIARDFRIALAQSEHGVLHAVGSSTPARAEEFAQDLRAPISGTYAEVIAREDVDAVYVGTVHTTHPQLAIAATQSSKPVLCEKPVSPTLAQTQHVLAEARLHSVPFIEAFKYRFGPMADWLQGTIESGEIGEVRAVSSAFGFAAPSRTGRLFDPALAGGAVLDAGCYPVSFAVGVVAWAGGSLEEIEAVSPTLEVGPNGVEESAKLSCRLGGIEIQAETSIVRNVSPRTIISGTRGRIEFDNPWGSRSLSVTEATLVRTGEDPTRVRQPGVNPMAAEADALTTLTALEAPEMPWSHTVATATLLDAWRAILD